MLCLHALDINCRSCQWPLAGPVALSVSALMQGQRGRSEHRMSLQRHIHMPLLKADDVSRRTPSSIPQPQKLRCQLPDYKEPNYSAECKNSSWWQPSIMVTPQATHAASVCVNVLKAASILLLYQSQQMSQCFIFPHCTGAKG